MRLPELEKLCSPQDPDPRGMGRSCPPPLMPRGAPCGWPRPRAAYTPVNQATMAAVCERRSARLAGVGPEAAQPPAPQLRGLRV